MELDVRQAGRSATTLAVLAVVFLAGLTWAWSRVTEPFPERAEPSPCTSTLVRAGEDVAPPQILVTVLNAGGSNGLASQTMDKLAGFGFVQGNTGNAPTDTGAVSAQVWAEDPDDPAARLLASYLGKNVDVVDQPSEYPGVTIVVGKQFKGVRKGHPTVTAKADTYICTPPLSTVPDAAG